ncbi:TlpA disulfide reductase family protein [Winogradskyella sp. UBA3174]|uniref:TlpA disulfide reductase family protein n=1 Tax=Winogradskyella sp. UBA3174 TaxID=1947785 RepID=UPI0025ED8F50|nr:TlpA disulfide reductase family protein [Winogradskyella sp. UBA3174]|tara:strand:- start:26060 stop:27202 length:1143 start_codon:yes stop_codon:yes gene_type:complete
MKKFIVACLSITLFFNCNGDQFKINGTAEGFADGTQVMLQSVGEKGNEVIKDTVLVKNEKFTMQGSVEYPEVNFLSLSGSSGNLIFMLENSHISIEINKENIMQSTVTGSDTQNDMNKLQNGFRDIMDLNRKVVMDYRKTDYRTEPKKRDSLAQIIKEYGDQILALPLNFVKKHNDSYFSLNLIGLEATKPKFDVKNFIEAYNNLTPSLKISPRGVNVKKTLDSLYIEYKKTAYLDIGSIAPNFEAPSVDGKMISLKDIKGKVTIIDFWAAWCGPCRKANPNIVRIYNEYHDKGLEIISISLDGSQNQKNPKEAWLEAIEKDKLTWNHVSNLNYFSGPVAKLYNINSIPATYLLDKDGKIIAKNLRNYALEGKVKELLNN